MQQDFFIDRLENHATIVQPGEGARVTAGEGSCTFKVTTDMSNGRLGIYEIVVPSHTPGARLHYHRFMDEIFMVKKGRLTLQSGEDIRDLAEGAIAYVPRFTPHAFSNTSDEPLVVILIFNPAEKREGFFYGLFELLKAPEMDMKKFLQIYHKYDSYLVDPATMQPL
jgi:mannose-6-phosphate isomerase-like protein (cupin superfamily)